jgi:hypothetical protein
VFTFCLVDHCNAAQLLRSRYGQIARCFEHFERQTARGEKGYEIQKQQAKAQANKAGMMRAARVIMCLTQGGLELAVPFLTRRSELNTEKRAVQQASLENWFGIAAEDGKQQWCTRPPSTRGNMP